MRRRDPGRFLRLLPAVCCLLPTACAEKRERPKPAPETAASSQAAETAPAPAAPKPLPASFLASKVASGFLGKGGALDNDAVSYSLAADLDGDGGDEVVLVPGARFCGTGGCLPGSVYDERGGEWVEIGSLAADEGPRPVGEVTAVAPAEASSRGFRDLEIRRRPPLGPLTARYDGAAYRIAPAAPEADRLPERRAASLLLSAGRYDPVARSASLGLFDRDGQNTGARVEVVVTAPDGAAFRRELGAVTEPDSWHEARFPDDFPGAPAAPAKGSYSVEYLLDGKRLPGRDFVVK